MDNLAAELEAYEDKLKPFMAGAANGEASKPSHNNNILINNIYKGNDDNLTTSGEFLSLNRRENDFKNIITSLIKGGFSEKETVKLIEYIMLSCGDKPDHKLISESITYARSSTSKRERNLAQEIREWICLQDGYISSTEVYNCLQVSTREEKKNVSIILKRLSNEGLIEKYGEKAGVYRRIDREMEFMDFENADLDNTIDLSLPLGIHLKTKAFPKWTGIVAGVSGMGKTLFCFNAIAEMMGRFPIYYFNSEIGPEALKMKLSYFPIPISDWAKNMKVVDKWSFNNIADKIQPDAFNVIDYLEPEGEKAFNIHGVISDIIKRLNKGFALIAIQKKPGATMGTGGVYSIKAASLALALDWGKIEIVKNRFREADPFPSLNKINFEVHQGHKFVKQGSWYK
jgi:hypothetical protein